MSMMWEKDKTEAFAQEAEPILDGLRAVLEQHQIPYFFCACTKNLPDEHGVYQQAYYRAGRTPASYGRELPHGLRPDGGYCDEVSRHYAVSVGAKVVNDVDQEIGGTGDIREDYAVELDFEPDPLD